MTESTDALVRELAGKLLERGWVCATAESCTGGWVAQVLTSLPGSSDWFDCGFVSYSNAAKTRLLGVEQALIDRYGAVSEEVARAMAAGAVEHSDAQVAMAVTGIAGPDGGTVEKPVGTVGFGWVVPDATDASSEMRRFDGDREAVRRSSVHHALKGLIARL